jgi:hypothetical protein
MPLILPISFNAYPALSFKDFVLVVKHGYCLLLITETGALAMSSLRNNSDSSSSASNFSILESHSA